MKRDYDNLGTFDSKKYEGIFLNYSSTINAYRCYNIRSNKIIESRSVIVDDTKPRKIKIQEKEEDEETDDKENDEYSRKEDSLKREKDRNSIK